MWCGKDSTVYQHTCLGLTMLYRALRCFQNKESIVGKLFAKHIKLEEAKQFLQRARYGPHVALGILAVVC